METRFSTLVVVESGAAALGLGAHTRVVVQRDDETPAGFAYRVRAQLEGDMLQRVVLSAGPVHDFARIASRAQVAQSAAAFLAIGGGGSLVLAASDPRGELAQRALGEILQGQLGASVSVTVRDDSDDADVALPTAA